MKKDSVERRCSLTSVVRGNSLAIIRDVILNDFVCNQLIYLRLVSDPERAQKDSSVYDVFSRVSLNLLVYNDYILVIAISKLLDRYCNRRDGSFIATGFIGNRRTRQGRNQVDSFMISSGYFVQVILVITSFRLRLADIDVILVDDCLVFMIVKGSAVTNLDFKSERTGYICIAVISNCVDHFNADGGVELNAPVINFSCIELVSVCCSSGFIFTITVSTSVQMLVKIGVQRVFSHNCSVSNYLFNFYGSSIKGTVHCSAVSNRSVICVTREVTDSIYNGVFVSGTD